MKNYFKSVSLFLFVYFLSTVSVFGDELVNNWPREISAPEGVVVVYQPQPESLVGNVIKARAAIGIELKKRKEPIYGTVWFEAIIDTDRQERTATIEKIIVKQVRFPTQNKKKEKRLIEVLEAEIPKWDFTIHIDQLMSSLNLKKKHTDIPNIIFEPSPALLVMIDGDAQLVKVPDSPLQRVVNSPYTILFSAKDKMYYLNADTEHWYISKELQGRWMYTQDVPEGISKLAPKSKQSETADPEGTVPKIIVQTIPSELISSTGPAHFKPIEDTSLMYMNNTDSDVFQDTATKDYFVLLSGRWFKSKDLNGPWSSLASRDLPADFKKISKDSPMGTVLYAVSGSEIAQDAVLDTQIPQTSKIARNYSKMSVKYDGKPKFERIKGTNLKYAVNSITPVIEVHDTYYACDNAVWFVSDSPTGVWKVAIEVPKEIYSIPPSSPLYKVTFVKIYLVTDDTVYVGYTVGYEGTYVQDDTVVYGTGYNYSGWYDGGYYYYPRPLTWWLHARWNPRTGFRFGDSFSDAPFDIPRNGGDWYHSGVEGTITKRGYDQSYQRQNRAGYRTAYSAGRKKLGGKQRNAYKKVAASDKNMELRYNTPLKRTQKSRASQRKNNVYSDREGNVHRRVESGWEARTKEGWKSDAQRQAKSKERRQQVNKEMQDSKLRRAEVNRKMNSEKVRRKKVKVQAQRRQNLQRSYNNRRRGASRARASGRMRGRMRGRR